jgi:hypothetical protein
MSIIFMECGPASAGSPLLKRGHVRALQIKRERQIAFASPAILHTVVRFTAKR